MSAAPAARRVADSAGGRRLRHDRVHAAVAGALARISERPTFRVVHLSLQHDHIHLLVEAAHSAALESGMRALSIPVARRINKVLGRAGKVFVFRYHATPLTSPRQVRNALAYVLLNWRRHREDERGFDERTLALDHYSSADVARRIATNLAAAVAWERAGRPIRAWDTPSPLT